MDDWFTRWSIGVELKVHVEIGNDHVQGLVKDHVLCITHRQRVKVLRKQSQALSMFLHPLQYCL